MNELLNVITSNIWLITLLIVMFIRRSYRIPAMIVLASKVAFGMVPGWLLITMIIIGVLIDSENYSRTYSTARNREKKADKN